MKILYAMQGTGNGHLSRAREIIPHLLEYGEVDLLVSGTDYDVSLPYIITYKKHGLGFALGKTGGIDYLKSFKKLKPINFFRDIYAFPVDNYDVILNDFEPLTAWACKLRKKTCIALSHQSSFLSTSTPRPETKDKFAEWLFRNYAPVTDAIGFHFKEYDTFIRKPVIRREARMIEPTTENHITVYLPAYHDQFLVDHLAKVRTTKWHIFSRHITKAYQWGHIYIQPIENKLFLQSMASSSGVITGGGFEGPAEALYFKKKLMSIPIMRQYEQQSNALALKKMGISVYTELNEYFHSRLVQWLEYGKVIEVVYPDETAEIVSTAIKKALVINSESVFSNYSSKNFQLRRLADLG